MSLLDLKSAIAGRIMKINPTLKNMGARAL